MRHYTDSDIFDLLNRGNNLQTKLTDAIRSIGRPGIILNNKNKSQEMLTRTYKESIAMKVLDAIHNGELILANFSPDCTFPEFFPFAKVKRSGKDSMIIDVSRYTTTSNEDDELVYEINVPRLYIACVGAYLSLHLFGGNTVLPAVSYKYLAGMWSKMFNKVLLKTRVLAGNNERYNAFTYLTVTFFLTYYAQAPAPVIASIATELSGGASNTLLKHILEEINGRGLTPYNSISDFCELLFNAEITNTKGGNDAVLINHSMYMQKFIDSFGKNSIMALCSIDYFMYILISAYRKGNYVFDRAFEDIVTNRDMPRLLESLYKEL